MQKMCCSIGGSALDKGCGAGIPLSEKQGLEQIHRPLTRCSPSFGLHQNSGPASFLNLQPKKKKEKMGKIDGYLKKILAHAFRGVCPVWMMISADASVRYNGLVFELRAELSLGSWRGGVSTLMTDKQLNQFELL